MDYVNLGKSGLKVSRLCLGKMSYGSPQWRPWILGEPRVQPFVERALAWMLTKPHITAPIVGASKMEHLDQAVAVLEIKLSAEEIKRLEEPYQPHPVLGHS